MGINWTSAQDIHDGKCAQSLLQRVKDVKAKGFSACFASINFFLGRIYHSHVRFMMGVPHILQATLLFMMLGNLGFSALSCWVSPQEDRLLGGKWIYLQNCHFMSFNHRENDHEPRDLGVPYFQRDQGSKDPQVGGRATPLRHCLQRCGCGRCDTGGLSGCPD